MAQISTKRCDLCTENNGVFCCYECQHALCDLCRHKHDKIPSTRGHSVTDIQNVDLATFNTRSQCVSHEREFIFYCVKCCDLICSKCVTSTHKDHTFSEIVEMVLKERELAEITLSELKVKMENNSSLKENVRCNHLDRLSKESKHVIEDIESTYQVLQLFVESKKTIKITEIEDNEKLERQNLESFLQDIDHVNKHISRTCSELENILSEKHDLTFFTSFKTIQKDINHIDNVPESPKFPEVERFDKRVFYKEVADFIQSKADGSCKNCAEKIVTIDKIQKEHRTLTDKYNRAINMIKKKDEELQELIQKIDTLGKKSRDAELKATKNRQKKDKELKMLRDQIDSLKTEKEITDFYSAYNLYSHEQPYGHVQRHMCTRKCRRGCKKSGNYWT
ncbi:uncharacterized protein LOC143047263 isoform X2 [Mytilus galloprovincialis]|uniref:uncharacterized protein LOC143047263 isoform X2 n=1 Tax=Mytilus galloprovincialis TaxID=29158 RepID=UPI003F7B4539